MPECCENWFTGWYCPRCGLPVSFMEHGGSKPVPIGQIATKNVNVTQQLIQGDYIVGGGTKIGTAVTTVEASAAPEVLPPPPPDGAPESYPDPDAEGQTDDDGFQWIEHPEGSGIWFYLDSESGEWVHKPITQ
jgi:hypothetical protein